MKMIKLSVLTACFIFATALIAPAQAGDAAPDFSAKDISGQMVKLSALKGKVVLLDFWATWCPPCRVEVPHLLALQRRFKGKDFVLISVSLDRDLPAARQFVKDKAMDWVHIIDLAAGRELANLYQVEYIPSTFIIGRKGTIEARQLRGDELANKIAALLK